MAMIQIEPRIAVLMPAINALLDWGELMKSSGNPEFEFQVCTGILLQL